MNPKSGYIRQLCALVVCVLIITFVEERGTTAQVPPPNNQPPGRMAPVAQAIRFGDPLPDLGTAQLAAFAAGREEFLNVETPASGLGPIFNGASCVQCHNGPAPGGGSQTLVTRFGRMINGVFDPLADKGGSLLQRFAIDPRVREVVPPEANVVANRISPPLFGAGLIEAIPDAAILAGVRAQKPDGVRGRAALIVEAKRVTS